MAHKKANEKQFPLLKGASVADIYGEKDLLEGGFFSKNVDSEIRRSGQHLFSDVDYKFSNKNQLKNSFTVLDEGKFQFVINDLSQSASWDFAPHPWVKSLSKVLSSPEDFAVLRSFVKAQWGEDNFSELFRQFIYQGCFIQIPEDEKAEINVIYNIDGTDEGLDVFHWLVSVGNKAYLRWTEDFADSKTNGIASVERRFSLGVSSQLHKSFLMSHASQGSFFNNSFYRMDESSQLKSLDLNLFNKHARLHQKALLNGPKASCQFSALLLGLEKGYGDYVCSAYHGAPDTKSDQYMKTILDKGYRAAVNSFATIGIGASGSDSVQLIKNWLLDTKSQINTKPELKVYNDDVSASHGVTFGALDPEQFFYLQCRGVSKKKAEEILLRAFLDDLILHSGNLFESRFRPMIDSALAEYL